MDVEEEPGAACIPPIKDPAELLARLAESVEGDDWRSLQAYVLEQHLPQPEHMMEVVEVLAPCLNTHNLQHRTQLFTTARRCMTYCSRQGRPKEMVLAFLEAMEGFHDDARVVALLPCLQNALLQLPVRRGRSLELALDTIGCHLQTVPHPKNWDLEGEELKLLETDENVQRFLELVPAFLDFMEPFLEDGGQQGGGGEGRAWEVRVLKRHLLKLLSHPLCFLDLRLMAKEEARGAPSKTYSRMMAETLVQCLGKVDKNFYRLLIQQPSEEEDEKDEVPGEGRDNNSPTDDVQDADMDEENRENERRASGAKSLKEDKQANSEDRFCRLSGGTLLYLVEVEGQGQQWWPLVVSAQHLFHGCLPLALPLLSHPAPTAVHKGLSLLAFHLHTLAPLTLSQHCLDDSNVMKVINALIVVMRRCPVRQMRLEALQVFKDFFPALEYPGRFRLMKSVLASCEHAGVKAVVVGLVKQEIDAALKEEEERIRKEEKIGSGNGISAHKSEDLGSGGGASGDPALTSEEKSVPSHGSAGKLTKQSQSKKRGEYFFKDRLKQLLVLATRLPEGEASDLLEESDLVMGVLNLLRYLVLRDPKTQDLSGIWAMWGWLEADYLAKLRTGLDMSEGHYQLELKNVMQKTTKADKIEASLSVGGTTLPPMNHEQRVGVLRSALTTFDMIKCVLARLSEIADVKRKA